MTFADLLAAGLMLLALVVLATGGCRGVVFHVRFSLTAAWRPAVLALLVITVRHLGCRRPNVLVRTLALLAPVLAQLARLWPPGGPFQLAPDECVYLAKDTRRALPMPARELALVTGLMIVLTALITYPQAVQMHSVPDLGDPLFSIWRLAWVAHQLPRDPLHLFDANIFYPERFTLAYSDSILLPAVVASPFLWLGANEVTIYTLLFLSTFVLSGVAMYALVRVLTGRGDAALVSALVFAFYPFRFEHYSHLELMFSFWMPLTLLGLHRAVARGRIRDGVVTGGALAGQVYSCMYFGVFLAAYLVPAWCVLGFGWRRIRSSLKALVIGAVVAGAVLAPLAIPYTEAQRTVGERGHEEIAMYSATPGDYLNPHWRFTTYYKAFNRPPLPERQLFPGFLAVALALIALWPPLSISRLAYGVGLAFAFDVSLGFHGFSYSLLYRWVPLFHGLRVPARMSMLVGFSLAVLAGYGTARLTHAIRPSRRWLFVGLASLMILVESRPALESRLVRTKLNPIYEWFNGRPPSVLAELPPGSRDWPATEFHYLYASTFHWQWLVNGTSGFYPPSYWEFSAAMSGFPDERAMTLLRARGVEYVMIHEEFYGPAEYATVAARAAERADLREVSRARYRGSEARLYQVVR